MVSVFLNEDRRMQKRNKNRCRYPALQAFPQEELSPHSGEKINKAGGAGGGAPHHPLLRRFVGSRCYLRATRTRKKFFVWERLLSWLCSRLDEYKGNIFLGIATMVPSQLHHFLPSSMVSNSWHQQAFSLTNRNNFIMYAAGGACSERESGPNHECCSSNRCACWNSGHV